MTEIPEHLLKRSRERRAALSGEPVAESSAPAPASTPEAAAPAVASTTPAPAAAAPAAPAAPPPPPPPPAPKGTGHRSGIPVWVMPALLVLPLWAIVYVGAFGERGTSEGPVDLGAQVFARNCASCHGASGQGVGNFPALAGGDAARTFPDRADHVSWVQTGSAPFTGQTYGAGTRVATGGMPAFGSILSPEEIEAVVDYERNSL